MKVKKSLLIVLLCILGLGSILRVVSDNTRIKVINIQDDSNSKMTAYANERFFFYEPSEKAIFLMDKNGKSKLISNISEFLCLTANDTSLYYIDKDYLYQYDLKTEEIKKRKLIGIEDSELLYTDGIYVDDMYLYVREDTLGIYIFSAKDICAKVDIIDNENTNKNKFIGILDYINETCVTLLPRHNGEFTEIAIIDEESGRNLIGDYCFIGKYDDASIYMNQTLSMYKNFVQKEINNGYTYGMHGGNYDMQCSFKEDENLIILSSCYSYGRTANSGVFSKHCGDNLWYVNLQKQETICNYSYEEEEIIFYADTEKYIVFREGILSVYDMVSQKKISEHEASWFSRGSEHEIELCNDRWFIFRDGKLVDIVLMKNYLN